MSRRDEKDEDLMAGLPAPRAGEEVEVETRRREVVEEGSDSTEVAWDEDATKDELMGVAQDLDISGRSTMTKDELLRALDRAEGR
jgi:hypothetical protein